MEAIRLQQEEFETLRNIEIAEVQRLEVEIKRKAAEKERRIAQENKRVEDKRRLEESIAARAFSNQFLGELHINVFDMLQEQGHFYDPVKKEIEVKFMGDLIKNVVNAANSYEVRQQTFHSTSGKVINHINLFCVGGYYRCEGIDRVRQSEGEGIRKAGKSIAKRAARQA